MQHRLKGVLLYRKTHQVVDLFGYSTKGVPGVEVVGPSFFTRQVKEKITYFTRKQERRLPLCRYVLCIEAPSSKLSDAAKEAYKWLELPLLILFWSLTGFLPVSNLEECFTSGQLKVNGDILLPPPLPLALLNQEERSTVWIGENQPQYQKSICIKELFEPIESDGGPLFNFSSRRVS